MRRRGFTMVLGLAAGLLAAAPRAGAHMLPPPCDCQRAICSADGFEKELKQFNVDTVKGVTTWTYKICNQAIGTKVCGASECVGGTKNGFGCTVNGQCPGGFCQMAQSGGAGAAGDICMSDTDCAGACVPCAPDFAFDHVDIVLPGLQQCVTGDQAMSVSQLGCPNCTPKLTCKIADRDPGCPADLCAPGTGIKLCTGGRNAGDACTAKAQCDSGLCDLVPCQPVPSDNPLKVAQCVVTEGSLTPGKCVLIQLSVAGEEPTLGPGAIDEVTKAGNKCVTDSLCGPSCGCNQGPGCFTRTPGFWGTHPDITDEFLPVTVCGKTLNSTDAGVCSSVTEALCVAPGNEANKNCDRNPGYAQLVRQLAAAKLNLAVTKANRGTCGADIEKRIQECERLCDGTKAAISASGCITDLDTFNNSKDTVGVTPPPFNQPGPGDPSQCQAATGNGLVIGKQCTVDCSSSGDGIGR